MKRSEVAALCRAIGTVLRPIHASFKARIDSLESKTSGVADAGRVADLQDRQIRLESRIADFEKRVASAEKDSNAHRRHLENLEQKIGKLIHER